MREHLGDGSLECLDDLGTQFDLVAAGVDEAHLATQKGEQLLKLIGVRHDVQGISKSTNSQCLSL